MRRTANAPGDYGSALSLVITRVVGERGQSNELAFVYQTAPREPSEREPQSLAEPDRRHKRARGTE